jgi:hypothetical protein
MLPAVVTARPLALALPNCPENARMKNPHTGAHARMGFDQGRFPSFGRQRLPVWCPNETMAFGQVMRRPRSGR